MANKEINCSDIEKAKEMINCYWNYKYAKLTGKTKGTMFRSTEKKIIKSIKILSETLHSNCIYED